jgi:uncharacterized phiE125 gp8 family phage protein
MTLSLVAAPATEPITTEEAKLQARVDGSEDDALIGSMIMAARQWAEAFTNRAFVTQTWDLLLDDFPACDYIELPKAPLASVSSVSYVDNNGATQSLTQGTDYTVDAPAGPTALRGRVLLAYNASWPSVRGVRNAVTVRFVAGYGAAAAVPEGIKAALRMLVAELYSQRENTLTGTLLNEVPFAVKALLYPYRLVAF